MDYHGPDPREDEEKRRKDRDNDRRRENSSEYRDNERFNKPTLPDSSASTRRFTDQTLPASGRRESYEERPASSLYDELSIIHPPLPKPRRRKRRALLIFCLVGLLAIGVAAMLIVPRVTGTPPPFQCNPHLSSPASLSMYYDPETQGWMNDVIGHFNQKCQGQISVELHSDISGQAMQDILDGHIQPDIWSPASATWLQLLNDQWPTRHSGSDPFRADAKDSPSLVKSPVVIAMWKPMAEALGWPSSPIYWADIYRLSNNPQGWSAYGHSEWGNFKFGHTDPNFSETGLDAVLAENYAAAHKQSSLTLNDVNNPATRNFVTTVESSVIHYGDDTGAFADEMFNKGPAYLSAAVMDESMVAEANAGKQYSHLAYPVVAIYPQEGTFISDHPFAIPQTGLTSNQQSAALFLRTFLLNPAQQQSALTYSLRPGTNLLLNMSDSHLNGTYGVNPIQPLGFGNPTPIVIKKAKGNFSNESNGVDVMLLLDTSDSMNASYNGASKLEKAKEGLMKFVKLLSNKDAAGVTVFNDHENVLTTVSLLDPAQRASISSRINGVKASGSTLLFDTVADQVANLQNRTFDMKKIKAVVVLSDGINKVIKIIQTVQELEQKITPEGKDAGEGVKVYTIAYGNSSDINAQDLNGIASASGGKGYSGTPQSICQVYNAIIHDVAPHETSSC